MIDEPADIDADRIKRVVFCSGKVYYDLYQAREEQKLDTVALVRIEQLYPFPADEYAAAIARYLQCQRRSSGARKSRKTRAPGIRSSTA